MDGLSKDECSRFWPPKKCERRYSLLAQSKPNSSQYKDKWTVEIFRNRQASRERNVFFLLDPGSMFKHKDNHRVQSLEKTLEGLDHLSLNLAHKFDRYPPL